MNKPKTAQETEAFHRELYRKSLDSLRVYNPLDKDFTFIYDKNKFTIPNKNKDVGYGKGMKVISRYLAMKYAKEIKNYMINSMAKKNVEELMEQASDDLKIKYDSDPYERQKLYEMSPKTDNPELIKKIYGQVILGVEEEYGLSAEEKVPEGEGIVDPRPIEEQVFDSFDKKYVPEAIEQPVALSEAEPPVEKKYPINKKKKLVKEISQ